MNKQMVLGVMSLVLMASGCSMIKDTKDMKATTEQLKDKEQVISDNTEFLRSDLTTKESTDKFQQFLDWLFGRDANGLAQGNTKEGDMIQDARGAIQSMRFQYWKGEYADKNISMLDSQFALHINLLMNTLATYAPVDFKVDNWHPDGYYKAIGALGAFLGEEDDGYKDVLAAQGLKNLSLYDVFVQALRVRTQANRQVQLPESVTAVLTLQRQAIYLLQMRHNYIPMIILGLMPVKDPITQGPTAFSAMNDAERLMITHTGLSANFGLDNPKDPHSVGVAELVKWTSGLNDVLQTRQDLRDMGITPEYNYMMLGMLQHVDFGQAKLMALSASSLSPEQKVARDFAVAWDKVIHPPDASQDELGKFLTGAH